MYIKYTSVDERFGWVVDTAKENIDSCPIPIEDAMTENGFHTLLCHMLFAQGRGMWYLNEASVFLCILPLAVA